MGNLIQRLFSSVSHEPGSKRTISKHNKVSFNDSNGKSKSPMLASEPPSEAVLFCKSFKSPSNYAIQSPTLNKCEDSIDSLQSISQESLGSPSQNNATQPKDDIKLDLPSSQINPPLSEEMSPFQREYLSTHQPLVSLEKGRPRRSNIRRSSRRNTSMNKTDNVSKPNHRTLASVPSIPGDDVPLNRAIISLSNRADISQPETHSSQSAFQLGDEEIVDELGSPEPNIKSVIEKSLDELSPSERQKIAKSRISQLFIKREQTKHIRSPTKSREVVLSPEYERVYNTNDNYGHYPVEEDNQQEKRATKLVEEIESLHDQSIAVDDNDQRENEDADESPNSEVVPRTKAKLHGNPLLIDELKKRQSTLYQTTD